MKLLLLKGLPASGKSTYAKELLKEGNWVRSNKDDLRNLLHGGKWSHNNEAEVMKVRDSIVEMALEAGKNVVVDDTNYAPVHEAKMKELAKKYKAEFEVKEFDTDVETCIERDIHRGEKAVGEQVIRRMWRQHVAPRQERHVGDGNPAVIFDIDGTLAIKSDRSPFAWERVGEDTLEENVLLLLEMFKAANYEILVFSGRDEVCKEETEKWLLRNGITQISELRMRTKDDNRKDSEVKREFYDELKDRYDIKYVVDDRLQVCRLWWELGLCLLKVGDPDLEF